mmetsp:Transcript_11343/g.32584  ORF Transcript_11343/g.32584 Transcript_11343/m.32584 type:complete len:264 (+) Transcript_11343:479-1270(+)
MSPRYSRAPSPRPLLTIGEANLRELLAAMLLMMAPGCSIASAPPLYSTSFTQATLKPLSLHAQTSSISWKAWSARLAMLAMVVTALPSGMFNPSMTAILSSASSTLLTMIILAPASIAFWASSLLVTDTMDSSSTACAAFMNLTVSSSPNSSYESTTATAPYAALWAICSSSMIMSLLMMLTGPGTSMCALLCSSTNSFKSSLVHPPMRSSAITAIPVAPNSRNSPDSTSGSNTFSAIIFPLAIFRLYSAISVIVPLLFVSLS